MNKRKSISFGDKIFARVSKNGRTIFNFVSEKVANMADLISQLRISMRDVQGLVMIHIRNYHQGWGEDRPLMLYASKSPLYTDFPSKYEESKSTSINVSNNRQMFFPWETH